MKLWEREMVMCMRKSGVAEKYVGVVQDMYEGTVTVVSGRSDGWAQGGGGLTSRIGSQPFSCSPWGRTG